MLPNFFIIKQELKSVLELASLNSFFLMQNITNTAQKMKFSIKDFFSKCNQIQSFLRIWSHLIKKSLMENFIFCAVKQIDGVAMGPRWV